MTRLAIPGPHVPCVDGEGKWTVPWYKFFSQLVTEFNDLQDSFSDATTDFTTTFYVMGQY